MSVARGETLDIPIAAPDPDGNDVTFTGVSAFPGFPLPEFMTLLDNGDGTAVLRVQPGFGHRGNHPILLKATDDGDGDPQSLVFAPELTSEFTFVVTVESDNEKPAWDYAGDKVAVVGQPFALTLRARDLDEEFLRYDLSGLPAGATWAPGLIYGTIDISWMPTAAGQFSITANVTDSGNGDASAELSDSMSFTLTARAANQAPSLDDITDVTIAEGDTWNLSPVGIDPDGDPLTWSIQTLLPYDSFDPTTGAISWTPGLKRAGTYDVTLMADDGSASDQTTFTVTVTNTNQPPVIVPLHPQYGRENRLLQFVVVGADPDGDDVELTAAGLPDGVRFDEEDGVVRWKAGFEQAGEYTFTFSVEDPHGETFSRDVYVRIENVNQRPILTTPNHSATTGRLLRFPIIASDNDQNTTLTYSADGLPEGAVVNPVTGEFRWTPQPGQEGDHVFTVSVTDGEAITTQNVLVRAAIEPTPPGVTIELTPGIPSPPGTPITVTVLAGSLGPIAGVSATLDGVPLQLDAQGRATVTATATGKLRIEATAVDVDGLVGTESAEIKVRDADDTDAPEVSFTSDILSTVATGHFDITGSVSDVNLDTWQLQVADFGSSVFRTIADGESSASGILGSLSPKDYRNGFYTLRLQARDITGRLAVTEAFVEVNVQDRSGVYSVGEVDLETTLGGIPVQIVRTYDSASRYLSQSFGHGWQMAVRDADIRLNVEPTGREHFGVFNPLAHGTRLFVTLPDQRRVGFTFAPEEVPSPSFTYYRPSWVADNGVNYTLSSVDILLQRAGLRYYDLERGLPYNPASWFFEGFDYTLTAPDGTQFQLNPNSGVTRQINPDGRTLLISDSGIVADNDERISFVHDRHGRLTSVTLPNGESLSYRYSVDGELTEFVRSEDQLRRSYAYESRNAGQLYLAVANDGSGYAVDQSEDVPAAVRVQSNLGTLIDTHQQPHLATLAAGEPSRFVVSVTQAEIQSASSGRLFLTVDIQRTTAGLAFAAPRLNGRGPLEGHPSNDGVAGVFAITQPGLYLIDVAGRTASDAGDFSITVNVAGDITGDGVIDGFDSDTLEPRQGTITGDVRFDDDHDVNQDGRIDRRDTFLLAANYGFVAGPSAGISAAAPVFVPPAAPADLPAVRFGDDGTNNGTGDGSSGSSDNPPQNNDSPQSPTIPGIDGPLTTDTGDPVAWQPLANGQFDSAPASGDFSWAASGDVSVADGVLRLAELSNRHAVVSQTFLVPNWADTLRFTAFAGLNQADALPGDAFEVRLLNPLTGESLIGTPASLPLTDAALNIQASGLVHTSGFVSVDGSLAGDQTIDFSQPHVYEIDLTGLTTDSLATLSFTLVGFDRPDAVVVIDDVLMTALEISPPDAQPDADATDEDTSVRIPVLTNDNRTDFVISPPSLMIVQPPQSGTVLVDRLTGEVVYTPDPNFSGTDAFTYTVADVLNVTSEEVTVDVSIAPVADTPSLIINASEGAQDTPIPVDIFAALEDTDGSETLSVDITGLPAGASLTAGTQIAPGHYRLTAGDLVNLAVIPAPGISDDFTLDVTATATETVTQEAAATTRQLPVSVQASIGTPVQITTFVVNLGEAQRSVIDSLAVTFNQDVWIGDYATDVTVESRILGAPSSTAGEPIEVSPDRYHYDRSTWTLTIDMRGLAQEDLQYQVAFNTLGIRSATARNVRLGSAIPGSDQVSLGFHRLLGDFDGTDIVDQGDLDLFMNQYRTSSAADSYDDAYDLDQSGATDRFDFAVWRRQRGLTTDQHGPVIGAARIRPITIQQINQLDGSATAGPLQQIVPADALVSVAVVDTSAIASFTFTINGVVSQNIAGELRDGAMFLTRTHIETALGAALAEGEHTLVLNAVDAFGNVSEPFELPLVIDTIAPAAPNAPQLLADSDTGVSSIDGITNSVRPQFSVTAEPDTIIRLLIDSREVAQALTTDGSVTFVPNLQLFSNGTYSVTAIAEDSAGNVSPPSDAFTLTLDSLAPEISGFGVSDNGSSATETTQAVVTLTGRSEPGATIRINNATTTVSDTGSFTLADVNLVVGLNAFAVTATDIAGNESQQNLFVTRLGLESDAPVVNVSLQNDTGRSNTDTITSDATIVGTVTDVSNIVRLRASLDGGPFVDILDTYSAGRFTVSPLRLSQVAGGTLTQGLHSFDVLAEDEYLNVSRLASVSFFLDSVAPSTPDPLQTDLAPSAGGDLWSTTGTLTLSTVTEPNALLRIQANSQVVHEEISGGNIQIVTTQLADGTYPLTAVAVDVAGNVSPATAGLTISIDTVAPDTPTLRLAPGFDTEPVGDGETGLETVRFEGTTSANTTVTLYRIIDSVQIALATTTSDGDGNYAFDGVLLRDGSNELKAVASDAAGNRAETSLSLISNVPDTTGPVITAAVTNDIGHDTSDGISAQPIVVGMVNDASRVVAFRAGIDAPPDVDIHGTLVDGSFRLTLAHLRLIADGSLPDGVHSLNLEAEDEHGHVSASFAIDFHLETYRPLPPTLLNLADESDAGSDTSDNITSSNVITITADAESGMLVRLYVNGVETDQAFANSPVDFTVGPLPDGEHVITTTSEGVGGNPSPFTPVLRITVDTAISAPTLQLDPAFTAAELGPNHTTEHFVTIVGTADPGVELQIAGSDQTTRSSATGSFRFTNVQLVAGQNDVQVTATDVAGNTASSVITITSQDGTAPVISAALFNDTGNSDSDGLTLDPTVTGTVFDASGVASLTASLNRGTAADILALLNGDDLHISHADLDGLAGGTLQDGTHALEIIAIDSNGLASDTALIEFTLDGTKPTAVDPVDLLIGSDHGISMADNLTNDATPTFRVFISGEQDATVTLLADGVEVGRTMGSGVVDVTTDELSDGVHQITAVVKDAAANVSSPTPALTVTIDTEKPLQPVFDQEGGSLGQTVQSSITLRGTTEPNARIELSGTSTSTTADQDGNFSVEATDLVPGHNEFTIIATDDAGNTNQFTRTITKVEREVSIRLTNDTDDPTDNVTRDASVHGTLRLDTVITSLKAGLDDTPQDRFVDVTHLIDGVNFAFDTNDMTRINGAPLANGPHELHLIATGLDGLSSGVVTFTFDYETPVVPDVTTSVQRDAGSDMYDFRYVVLNRPSLPARSISDSG